jgi:hypothetical protein
MKYLKHISEDWNWRLRFKKNILDKKSEIEDCLCDFIDLSYTSDLLINGKKYDFCVHGGSKGNPEMIEYDFYISVDTISEIILELDPDSIKHERHISQLQDRAEEVIGRVKDVDPKINIFYKIDKTGVLDGVYYNIGFIFSYKEEVNMGNSWLKG